MCIRFRCLRIFSKLLCSFLLQMLLFLMIWLRVLKSTSSFQGNCFVVFV